MTYVEWLRVRGALKWTAIVLGICLVLVLLVRVWAAARGGDTLGFVHLMEHEKGTQITHATLPDGTPRTIYDNPAKQVHITVDDYGYQGEHIEVLDRSGHAHKDDDVSMGSVGVRSLPSGGGTQIVIDTNQPESFAGYAAIATFVAMIIATILGAPFARENDGHLEIALTKPVSRELLGLATIGVDLAGIFGAWLLTAVALIVGHAIFEMPHLTFGTNDALATVLGLLGAFSWYAMLCAATASMKRAYGIVLGVAWPAALIVVGLGKIQMGSNAVLQALHLLGYVLSFVDPLNYLHFGPAMEVNGHPEGALAFVASTELPALIALLIVYVGLAVLQWRRVEA